METVVLTEDLFLGDGNHKIAYRDPRDAGRCIKVLRQTPDPDLRREFAYRKSLGKRAASMTLLTAYYGTVPTNLGEGYVFELVRDFDGKTSRTMLEVLDEAAKDPACRPEAGRMLLQFRDAYFREEFLVAGMDPDNFLVQRVSPEESRVRIIDNIGCSATVPLAYYFGRARRVRLKKYWKRFLDILENDYSILLTEDLRKSLSDMSR